MFFYDSYYWTILLPVLLLAMVAQARVSSTFHRYQQVPNRRGMTGRQAAEQVLRAHGVNDVQIERISGKLTDHYDPRSNVIRLSQAVYDSTSVAAVGVAAHEAGHAVQYATDYGPIRMRNAIIPMSNFGSQLSFILLLVGLLFYNEMLFGLGVIFFSVAMLAQIITLPVEFNASSRAMQTLESAHILDDEELRGAKKVLSAAAMT